MSKFTRTLALLASIAVVSSAFVACGSGNETTSSSAAPAAENSSSAAPAEEAATAPQLKKAATALQLKKAATKKAVQKPAANSKQVP